MKIWHFGACNSLRSVNGINSMVWSVSMEQALQGHEIALVLNQSPDDSAIKAAQQSGIALVVLSNPRQILPLLDQHRQRPDLAHLHSVFVPYQATVTKALVRARIPHVITPNGGLSSHVLRRGRIKKIIYSALIEKPRFRSAAAITVVAPSEEDDVRAFIPNYSGPIRWIANPVDVPADVSDKPELPAGSRPQLIFLGRLEVYHKGLDILVEVARLLPEADFHLYGNEDPRTKTWLASLRRNSPLNVHFHDPVFGDDKVRVLREATLYIQTSRWEGFALSIAEAMSIGTPCALSRTLGMAKLFEQNNLGLALPTDPTEAAWAIRKLLANVPAMHQYAAHARAFALEHFVPANIASKYLDLYSEILAAHQQNSPPTDAVPAAATATSVTC